MSVKIKSLLLLSLLSMNADKTAEFRSVEKRDTSLTAGTLGVSVEGGIYFDGKLLMKITRDRDVSMPSVLNGVEDGRGNANTENYFQLSNDLRAELLVLADNQFTLDSAGKPNAKFKNGQFNVHYGRFLKKDSGLPHAYGDVTPWALPTLAEVKNAISRATGTVVADIKDNQIEFKSSVTFGDLSLDSKVDFKDVAGKSYALNILVKNGRMTQASNIIGDPVKEARTPLSVYAMGNVTLAQLLKLEQLREQAVVLNQNNRANAAGNGEVLFDNTSNAGPAANAAGVGQVVAAVGAALAVGGADGANAKMALNNAAGAPAIPAATITEQLANMSNFLGVTTAELFDAPANTLTSEKKLRLLMPYRSNATGDAIQNNISVLVNEFRDAAATESLVWAGDDTYGATATIRPDNSAAALGAAGFSRSTNALGVFRAGSSMDKVFGYSEFLKLFNRVDYVKNAGGVVGGTVFLSPTTPGVAAANAAAQNPTLDVSFLTGKGFGLSNSGEDALGLFNTASDRVNAVGGIANASAFDKVSTAVYTQFGAGTQFVLPLGEADDGFTSDELNSLTGAVVAPAAATRSAYFNLPAVDANKVKATFKVGPGATVDLLSLSDAEFFAKYNALYGTVTDSNAKEIISDKDWSFVAEGDRKAFFTALEKAVKGKIGYVILDKGGNPVAGAEIANSLDGNGRGSITTVVPKGNVLVYRAADDQTDSVQILLNDGTGLTITETRTQDPADATKTVSAFAVGNGNANKGYTLAGGYNKVLSDYVSSQALGVTDKATLAQIAKYQALISAQKAAGLSEADIKVVEAKIEALKNGKGPKNFALEIKPDQANADELTAFLEAVKGGDEKAIAAAAQALNAKLNKSSDQTGDNKTGGKVDTGNKDAADAKFAAAIEKLGEEVTADQVKAVKDALALNKPEEVKAALIAIYESENAPWNAETADAFVDAVIAANKALVEVKAVDQVKTTPGANTTSGKTTPGANTTSGKTTPAANTTSGNKTTAPSKAADTSAVVKARDGSIVNIITGEVLSADGKKKSFAFGTALEALIK